MTLGEEGGSTFLPHGHFEFEFFEFLGCFCFGLLAELTLISFDVS